MPISLATVNARRATVKISIENETLNVTYNRSVITPDLQAKIKDWGETDVGSLVLFTKAAVVEWDLLGEDGKPLPLDEKTLGAVPTDIHILIHRAIYTDIDPNADSPESTG
jgi:hypothetical protein